MKRIVIFTGVFVLIIFATNNCAQQSDFPVLIGPYLGQKPPGRTAQPFAVNVFKSRYRWLHSNVFFSPDGKEVYWQSDSGYGSRLQAIFESKYENGIWTSPQVAFFSSLVAGGMEDAPFISPDGNKFFFLSGRQIEKGDKSEKYNIWVMDRTKEGWSIPQPLPPIVNSLEGIHWRLSVDKNYNLYFGTWKPQEGEETTGDIYCSKYENGQYTKPEKLDSDINVAGYNRSPFIAPDGSYLIFCRSIINIIPKLFICFRKSEEKWTKPKDLSEIIGRNGLCPIVTIDGKYLFFLVDGQPFWIDASFIEELRKTELK